MHFEPSTRPMNCKEFSNHEPKTFVIAADVALICAEPAQDEVLDESVGSRVMRLPRQSRRELAEHAADLSATARGEGRMEVTN